MLLTLMTMAALTLQNPASAPMSAACPEQPLPPAIDSAGAMPAASDLIEFAATPSLEHPGRAWVVRLSRRGTIDATIQITRLRRQQSCNRYDVEARWQAPLSQGEYDAVARRVAPLGVPARNAFIPSMQQEAAYIVLDGTSLNLRLRSHGWQAMRMTNSAEGDGPNISAIFRDLVARHVPASELPTTDWRTLRHNK